MMDETTVFSELLAIVNDVKRTGFDTATGELDAYLGGELGIDSIELLEIWFEVENRFGIRVEDAEKRDLYTVQDVVSLVRRKLREPDAARARLPA